jgi:hypothetical protein
VLGLRLVVDKLALDDTERRVAVMQKAVADLRPDMVHVPSMDDSHPGRMDAFRVSTGATADVATVLAYQTATTRMEYHPKHFIDVTDQMATKLEALSHFQSASGGRVDLRPEIARAYAHYWGRHRRSDKSRRSRCSREMSSRLLKEYSGQRHPRHTTWVPRACAGSGKVRRGETMHEPRGQRREALVAMCVAPG